MTVRSQRAVRNGWWQLTEGLLGIVGGIAAFLGFFALFAPEEELLGISEGFSWQVAEVSTAVAYGLTIGGLLFVAAAVAMMLTGRGRLDTTPTIGLPELIWHTGVFAVVNAFIWIQDLVLVDGAQYAYWVTIPWAVVLAVHAVWYNAASRRARMELVASERDRELVHH